MTTSSEVAIVRIRRSSARRASGLLTTIVGKSLTPSPTSATTLPLSPRLAVRPALSNGNMSPMWLGAPNRRREARLRLGSFRGKSLVSGTTAPPRGFTAIAGGRSAHAEGGSDGRDAQPSQSCRRDRIAAVGRPHGPERRPARLRLRPQTFPRPCAGQPDQGRRGGPRGDGHSAKQHRDRPDDRVLRQRRLRRARSGARRDARRQCRNDADRAGAVLRRLAPFADPPPARRADVRTGERERGILAASPSGSG